MSLTQKLGKRGRFAKVSRPVFREGPIYTFLSETGKWKNRGFRCAKDTEKYRQKNDDECFE